MTRRTARGLTTWQFIYLLGIAVLWLISVMRTMGFMSGKKQKFSVQLRQIATLPSVGAQGLASWTDSGSAFIIVANWYSDSTLFTFDGKEARKVQTIPTRSAHDWEDFMIGSERFVAVANFEGDTSQIYKYSIGEDSTRTDNSSQPMCEDAFPTCEAWAKAGECKVNPGFMRTSCKASCDTCPDYSGPLRLVQALPTAGASAVEHFTAGHRHFLAFSHYRATEAGVTVFQYQHKRRRFEVFQTLATPGVAEFGWCSLEAHTRKFLATAVYHAGSFVTPSVIWELREGHFQEFQSLDTSGAHDWECFNIADDTFLVAANVRNEHNQTVWSVVYKWLVEEFVPVQWLLTSGAHDWELFNVQDQYFMAVANQGDGRDCGTGSVQVFSLDPLNQKAPLTLVQELHPGCAVFVDHFLFINKHYIAVAIERVGDLPNEGYQTQSLIYEAVLQ